MATRGRPKFGYFILECPSDHEIDGWLPSESDVIRAVLTNKSQGSRLKQVTCSTVQSFNNIPNRTYSGARYVHIGGHGSKTDLGFIGGKLKWGDIAIKLVSMFPALKSNEQRVLTLSCCHSKTAANVLKPLLNGHFTAIYHFEPEEISFSVAITVWNMFYFKKGLRRPHQAIVNDINTYLGSTILEITPV